MIVIISENTDAFTSTVENWLNHYKKEYIRVNSEQAIGYFNWELLNSCCEILISDKIGQPEISPSKSIV